MRTRPASELPRLDLPIVTLGQTHAAGVSRELVGHGVWVFVWRGRAGSGPPGHAQGGRISMWAYPSQDAALDAAMVSLAAYYEDADEHDSYAGAFAAARAAGDREQALAVYNEEQADTARFADVRVAPWGHPAAGTDVYHVS